jgi:HAD superfamily hydrolase (TIGR01549 family)
MAGTIRLNNQKEMKYKHLIFDIDGTLLDTEYSILHSLQDTLADIQNKDLDINELTFALGIPGEVTLRKLGVQYTKHANKIWNNNLLKYSSSIKLFDGISELLPELQNKGYQLGIITSKNPQEFTNDFEPHNISGYFSTILCVTDSPRPKPFADPILSYLERTNTSKEEVIYIGDTIYDYQCALNAGVDFGLAVWGNASRKNIDAKYFFCAPKDILEIK